MSYRDTHESVPVHTATNGYESEIVTVCPVCEEVTDTEALPTATIGRFILHKVCMRCIGQHAELEVMNEAETYIDMMDNPGHAWNANSLAVALAAVAKGYRTLQASILQQSVRLTLSGKEYLAVESAEGAFSGYVRAPEGGGDV